MRKFFNIINIVFFCLLISAQQASAQAIKFDISKSLGKITTTVSGWLETAKKQMDQAATLQTMIAYGKGAVETAKKIKELEGGIGAAISETEALAEGSIGSVNGGLQSIQSEASSIGSKSPSQMEDAQKLLELKAQKTMLESERDEAIAAAQDEVNGKKALAEENIAKLQDMISWEPDKKLEYESQIAYYQGEITNYEKELDKTTGTIQQQYQSEISAIDKQISELREKAASEAGKAAEEKLGSVLGGGDEETTAAMNEMIKNNFLAADEEETVENITPRKVYRKLTAAKDTVAAFNNAWRVKKSRYENDKKALEKLAEFRESIGDYKAQADYLLKLYHLDKRNSTTVRKLGEAYEKLRNKPAAVECYQKYLEIGKGNPDYSKIQHKLEKLNNTEMQEEEGFIDKIMKWFNKD